MNRPEGKLTKPNDTLKYEAKRELSGSISRERRRMTAGAYFAAVFESVVHDMPREQAVAYVSEGIVFFDAGRKGTLKFLQFFDSRLNVFPPLPRLQKNGRFITYRKSV